MRRSRRSGDGPTPRTIRRRPRRPVVVSSRTVRAGSLSRRPAVQRGLPPPKGRKRFQAGRRSDVRGRTSPPGWAEKSADQARRRFRSISRRLPRVGRSGSGAHSLCGLRPISLTGREGAGVPVRAFAVREGAREVCPCPSVRPLTAKGKSHADEAPAPSGIRLRLTLGTHADCRPMEGRRLPPGHGGRFTCRMFARARSRRRRFRTSCRRCRRLPRSPRC